MNITDGENDLLSADSASMPDHKTGQKPTTATRPSSKGANDMWPIENKHVIIGTRLKRTWQTPRGKTRFQVREVLEIGTHLRRYEPQLDDDCCRYLIVDGWQAGKEGRCARAYLASWAQEIVGQN